MKSLDVLYRTAEGTSGIWLEEEKAGGMGRKGIRNDFRCLEDHDV